MHLILKPQKVSIVYSLLQAQVKSYIMSQPQMEDYGIGDNYNVPCLLCECSCIPINPSERYISIWLEDVNYQGQIWIYELIKQVFNIYGVTSTHTNTNMADKYRSVEIEPILKVVMPNNQTCTIYFDNYDMTCYIDDFRLVSEHYSKIYDTNYLCDSLYDSYYLGASLGYKYLLYLLLDPIRFVNYTRTSITISPFFGYLERSIDRTVYNISTKYLLIKHTIEQTITVPDILDGIVSIFISLLGI